MRDLIGKLEVVDGDTAGALRVIDHFDRLVENRVSVAAVVRTAAALAGCPAGLHDAARGVTHRFTPAGRVHTGAPVPAEAGIAVPGRLGSRVWLERPDAPRPLDPLIVERAARAFQALTGDVAPDALGTLVRIACDHEASAAERRAAATRLGLAGPVTVLVTTGEPGARAARIDGHTVTLLADGPPELAVRSGTAVADVPEDLPAALARARLAFAVADRPGGAGPVAVAYADLGALAAVAERFTPEDAAAVPDVQCLTALMARHAWVVDTVQAVLDQPSLRQAAAVLHVHHSTLQERLTWLGERLGYALTRRGGRQRAAAAVLLWRLARSVDGS